MSACDCYQCRMVRAGWEWLPSPRAMYGMAALAAPLVWSVATAYWPAWLAATYVVVASVLWFAFPDRADLERQHGEAVERRRLIAAIPRMEDDLRIGPNCAPE